MEHVVWLHICIWCHENEMLLMMQWNTTEMGPIVPPPLLPCLSICKGHIECDFQHCSYYTQSTMSCYHMPTILISTDSYHSSYDSLIIVISSIPRFQVFECSDCKTSRRCKERTHPYATGWICLTVVLKIIICMLRCTLNEIRITKDLISHPKSFKSFSQFTTVYSVYCLNSITFYQCGSYISSLFLSSSRQITPARTQVDVRSTLFNNNCKKEVYLMNQFGFQLFGEVRQDCRT